MKILHVVGARPNFMKIAPIISAFNTYNQQHRSNHAQVLVHTGQHYDHKMSQLFFDQLGIPKPDINLEIGSGSHAQQTGQIMLAFESVLVQQQPDLVVVVGDVNSTMACAIDSKKLNIPVAHVEAGLRSRDMSMPEEINRLLTDAISDILFTTDKGASLNLRNEGIAEKKIKFVGNVMIDTLLLHKNRALQQPTLDDLELKRAGVVMPYAVLTLHRPSNVDDESTLAELSRALLHIGKDMPIIFPVHPRTMLNLKKFNYHTVFTMANNIRLIEPLGYLDFLNLTANAKLVLTDSGGIQEETTILGVPCLTLRNNTERPVTVEHGTNRLVGTQSKAILAAYTQILNAVTKKCSTPEYWDGSAAKRIVDEIVNWC
ncbi:MAG: UDP-N-acetylglucosamine 2-epimerase (non-hydrolyzing) [Gammaproteobacteria bacterium]|nr:UDP-N-acetylglucosamine 2-epimerase (non-hydrolyzing) [Gammaproteobacteria bacterium]